MGKRGTRAFSEEFRREALRLIEAGEKPVAQIARELGVHHETLRGWRRRAHTAGEMTSAAGTVPSLEEENRRLRRENVFARDERLRSCIGVIRFREGAPTAPCARTVMKRWSEFASAVFLIGDLSERETLMVRSADRFGVRISLPTEAIAPARCPARSRRPERLTV